MTPLPLRRNRDFVLLQTGQLLSSAGNQIAFIAWPLLVLAVTGSPAKAGLVSFVRLLPSVLFAIPAGLAADRYDRRRLMLGADGVRALGLAVLAAAVLDGSPPLWLMLGVGFVQGSASTVFRVAETGAVKAVVPPAQLPAAVGAIQARQSAVMLVGPAVGGALFGLGRALPFVVDALSYAFSFFSLALMRTPFQKERESDRVPVRTRIADGFRFLWNEPFVRFSTFFYGIGNFSIPGMLLVLVVVAEEDGLGSGPIGLMLVLLAALTLQGITLPVTNSVVDSYRIAIIPDRLLGRVETVGSQIGLAIAPLGPLVAGFLLSATSARVTVACFLVFSAALVVWGTLSSALKAAPDLRDLDVDALLR